MRKLLPYVAIVAAVVLLGALLLAGIRKAPRRLDDRITLNHHDKIPYGTSAAQVLMPSLFPDASVYYDHKAPGLWDSINSNTYGQAVVLMAKKFDADDLELNRLLSFAQKGNYIFIIARSFSREAIDFFRFYYNENLFDANLNVEDDSLTIRLEKPVFSNNRQFIYPGKKYESALYSLDTTHTLVLGRNREGFPNFVRFRTGNGSIFIHTAPLAFSNYFILHKDNISYFKNAFSVIPESVNKIDWNEYYLTKPARVRNDQEPSWFRVLFRYPAFQYGLLTGLITLSLLVILGMRRKQAMIPAFERPHNDSLDFVKTLGRLYYDKGDHLNLAKKMAVYFQEYVRNGFKLSSDELDEGFIQSLHYKSAYPADEISSIVTFINNLKDEPVISDDQLSEFYKKLELFYQNT